MNRRAALAALMTLPAVTKIAVAPITPRDVIVIECPGPLSLAQIESIKHGIARIWPDTKCIVLCDGMRLKVVAADDPERPV